MDGNTHLLELLRYFMETSSLAVLPENTRLYRMILLRILYSVGNIDIQECIQMLLDHGIFIGSYDAPATVSSLFQKLTTMPVEDWIALTRYLRVESTQKVFAALDEVYKDTIADSPLWNLKNTFEEHSINIEEFPHMLLHVYLVIFNREIDSGNAIGALLQRDMSWAQTNDLRLRVLGQMNNSYSPGSIGSDMCVLLRFVEFGPLAQLQTHMRIQQGLRVLETEDVADVKQVLLLCRPSLLLIQKKLPSQANFEHTNAGVRMTQQDAVLPCDLPLSAETWAGYSCAQQQVVLLLASIRLDCIQAKEQHVEMIVGTRGRLSFDQYHTPKACHANVAPQICSLLLRIGDALDMQKLETCTVSKTFADFCFPGVFGNLQIQILTPVFYVQMYVLSFFESALRIQCYNDITEKFNRRLQASQQHMMLPEYIPHTLSDKMDSFSAQNQFPIFIVEQVFRPLCV